jgi:hypothetical protein
MFVGMAASGKTGPAHLTPERLLSSVIARVGAQKGGIEEKLAAESALVAFGRMNRHPVTFQALRRLEGLTAVATPRRRLSSLVRDRGGMTLAKVKIKTLVHRENLSAKRTDKGVDCSGRRVVASQVSLQIGLCGAAFPAQAATKRSNIVMETSMAVEAAAAGKNLVANVALKSIAVVSLAVSLLILVRFQTILLFRTCQLLNTVVVILLPRLGQLCLTATVVHAIILLSRLNQRFLHGWVYDMYHNAILAHVIWGKDMTRGKRKRENLKEKGR